MTGSDTLVQHDVISHELNDTWVLYAHLPHDTDWTLNSYKKILTIKTVEQIIAICEELPEPMIQNCMLFLMRENIKPIWEDDNNKNGGCFSYKINNKNVSDIWRKLSCLLVGETLINEKMRSKVNGITISPKKAFCIVKIWTETLEHQNPQELSLPSGLSYKGCIFKKHKN